MKVGILTRAKIGLKILDVLKKSFKNVKYYGTRQKGDGYEAKYTAYNHKIDSELHNVEITVNYKSADEIELLATYEVGKQKVTYMKKSFNGLV